MNPRVKWLRDKIKSFDLQGMIVTNPISIKYLIGIDAEGVLLVTRKENIFITDGRYIEKVNNVLTIEDEIIVENIKDLTLDDYESFFTFCENVGFEEYNITYAQYKEYIQKYQINNFEETDAIIEKQRIIKDDDELAKIKKACSITDDCFEHLRSFIKVGQTEKEIALEIERFFRMHGAEGLAFDTIVASGVNSSMPHAVPTDKKIEEGDPITIDMGCKYQGYCSDMTRTVFARRIPTEIKSIYDLVLKKQIQIAEEMKDGSNTRLLSKSVESDFRLAGYELIHSLGHGIGLEIHELPTMSSKYDFFLRNNMVVTNEPGIYVPGKFGVRIEDTVLITKYGCMNLTKSDKNYIVVG